VGEATEAVKPKRWTWRREPVCERVTGRVAGAGGGAGGAAGSAGGAAGATEAAGAAASVVGDARGRARPLKTMLKRWPPSCCPPAGAAGGGPPVEGAAGCPWPPGCGLPAGGAAGVCPPAGVAKGLSCSMAGSRSARSISSLLLASDGGVLAGVVEDSPCMRKSSDNDMEAGDGVAENGNTDSLKMT